MAKRRRADGSAPGERPIRLTAKAVGYLDREARAALARQRRSATVYDGSALVLFALSAVLIAGSGILGSLELASSSVGALSWIAIGVTGLTWVVGWWGQRMPLADLDVSLPAADRGRVRRRGLAAAHAERARGVIAENDRRLLERRRWVVAFAQLVALETAVIVAVELAARG